MNTALEIEWDHFVHSPSRKDGIPEHVERYLRTDTCKFIDEFGLQEGLGGKLRLLACSLFHTFYLRVSFKAIPRWETAVACLIIAAKIENKVQTIKKITTNAADYLRPHCNFRDKKTNKHTIPPQQLYHWMSQIHIRERQVIERLYGELRTSLPIQSLDITKLRQIIATKDNTLWGQKTKTLSDLFKDCFKILRKMCVIVLRVLRFQCLLALIYAKNTQFSVCFMHLLPPAVVGCRSGVQIAQKLQSKGKQSANETVFDASLV